MSKWKSKAFGDNKINFYGWGLAGLVVVVGALGFFLFGMKMLVEQEKEFSPELCLFISHFLLLTGIFGIMVQNYMARVAERIEKEEEK